MKAMLQFIDRLLSLLPFNGDKTKIGALIQLAVFLHGMFPGFDVLAWLAAQLGAIGVPTIVIGVIHKAVKKLLNDYAPDLLTQSSAKAKMTVDPKTKFPVPPESVPASSKI